MAPCKFNLAWLNEVDINGNKIKDWGKSCCDIYSIYCCVCEKKVCIKRGKNGINQHAQGASHKNNYKTKMNLNQLHLNLNSNDNMVLRKPKQEATKVEILWTLRLIMKNQSFESIEGIKEIFTCMDPEVSWLQYFSLSPKKLAYYVNHALAPFFMKSLLADIKGTYTLLYDETTNKATQKELQIKILYWSDSKNEICIRHLKTCFLQHAKSEDILNALNTTILDCKLNRNYLLMLGSDGPNINKKVLRLMSNELILQRNLSLVDIGTCNLHVINNAFLKGLEEFGSSVVDLVVAIRYFFKDKPSRLSDYEYCQKKTKVPRNNFIKHVPSRWLTLESAANRVIEQWPAIIEYFLKYIPKQCKQIEKTNTYKTIKQILLKSATKAEVVFLSISARFFVKFSVMFQSNAPLIHLIYDEIKQLVTCLFLKICKPEAMQLIHEEKFSENIFDTSNLIPLEEYKCIVGTNVADELEASKVQLNEIVIFTGKVRQHYLSACKYILKKIPIFDNNNILKKFKCISPRLIRSTNSSVIVDVAKLVPYFHNFNDLEDEWRLLQIENFDESFEGRVDHFWRNIFEIQVNQTTKYSNLKIVVKSILSLSHGNADVERGFSLSSRILTQDRSRLHEKTLNSILIVSDTLKCVYNNKIENINISSELLNLARSAHASYTSYHEEVKRKQREETELQEKIAAEKRNAELQLKIKEIDKQQLKELENDLRTIQDKDKVKKKAAKQLLDEANKKLQRAITNKNFVEANVAQGLIQASQNMLEEEQSIENEVHALQKRVNKRKADLLDYFYKKRKDDT